MLNAHTPSFPMEKHKKVRYVMGKVNYKHKKVNYKHKNDMIYI